MSTEYFFPALRSRQWLRVGPLAGDLDGFATWLAAEGYARPSAKGKLRLVRNLSFWLEQEGRGVEALDEQRFEAFLLTRGPRSNPRDAAATGRQLLRYLRGKGRIPVASPDPGVDCPLGRIEGAYAHFLLDERGLSSATVVNDLPIVHAFLSERFATQEVVLERLFAQDANRFILRHSQHLSRSRTKLLATALRSFLRHLYQRGDIAVDLAGAVLPVMNWRLSGLPKSLTPEQVGL